MNITVIILIALLLGALILIGREFEERYAKLIDYKADHEPSTLQQQMRTGAYVLFDYISDMCWPGNRTQAYAYKRMKGTG